VLYLLIIENEEEGLVELPASTSVLRKMKEMRLSKLRKIDAVLAGTLVKRKNQGGYNITDKVNGKTRTVHISEGTYERAKAWNENHREAKRLLQELSEIQRGLMKAEKD
jgi:hypothetical protein